MLIAWLPLVCTPLQKNFGAVIFALSDSISIAERAENDRGHIFLHDDCFLLDICCDEDFIFR